MDKCHVFKTIKFFKYQLIICLNQFDKMKKLSTIILCLLLFNTVKLKAQTLREVEIDSVYTWSRLQFPLIQQVGLLEKSEQFSLENVSKSIWPQIMLGGQASYQSDVTQLSIPLPGFSPPEMSKDQYRIFGEITQPLTDLVTVRHQKAYVKANAKVEREKTEIEFQKLKERVNQIYFGILLLDAQLKQTELLELDVQQALKKTRAAVENGVSTTSQVDIIQAELFKIDQKKIELSSARKTYVTMLGAFIKKPISDDVQLKTPKVKPLSSNLNRPELRVFENQTQLLDVQNRLVDAKLYPRFSAFLQTGYGRPALNMLNNNFDTFYIGGLRLNWNLSAFYTSGNERNLVGVQQRMIQTQKEVFLFNTDLQLKQQSGEWEKLEALIASDKEIIALRERIKKTSSTQLENGTLTATDYLILSNAEDQARQNLELHRIQQVLMQYNYNLSTGNE